MSYSYNFNSVVRQAKDLGYNPEEKIKKSYPLLPKNKLEWIKKARPFVGKIRRTFDYEPFWIALYEDESPDVIAVTGRQNFKSTFLTDIIACGATTHEDAELLYIADTDSRANAWSKQRFRKDTMLKNELLEPFLIDGRASVSEINFINDSVLYVRTDENEFQNCHGLSPYIIAFDEAQYQELQFRSTALYGMTHTRGQAYYLGIGGESGSEWNRMWKNSDQKEWHFDDKYWREKLKFDDEGFLINEHPENIVSGKWIAKYPSNKANSGYHMGQPMFARIPLTISDAVNLYKTRPEVSIEYQIKYNPKSTVEAHVFGNFYHALRRPISQEMVEACYDYTKTLLTGNQVRELKNKYQNEIQIFLGIDWGSSPDSSYTVGAVIIYWRKSNRYQLAFIDRRPQEHEYDQAYHFVNLFNEYSVDFCLADLGYGKDKVTQMQNGGYSSHGAEFKGLSKNKVMGVWFSGSITQDTMKERGEMVVNKKKIGERLPHISIDKTQNIQNVIDYIGTFVPDAEGKKSLSQFIIPMKNDWECDFLVDDFCDITRKDLNKDNQEIRKEDPRAKPRREFNHPKDTVVAISLCFEAKKNYKTDFGVTAITQGRKIGLSRNNLSRSNRTKYR